MSEDRGELGSEAVEVFFRSGGIRPDAEATAHVRADLARLRGLADLVHSVREADELDGVLVFDPDR